MTEYSEGALDIGLIALPRCSCSGPRPDALLESAGVFRTGAPCFCGFLLNVKVMRVPALPLVGACITAALSDQVRLAT